MSEIESVAMFSTENLFNNFFFTFIEQQWFKKN